MACNCTPVKTIRISSLNVTDTGVVLIPETAISETDLVNLFYYRLIIPCTLSTTSILPIFIQTAAGNVPVLCKKSSNSVLSNQIRKMLYYTLVYGNQNSANEFGQFVIQNNLC